MGVGNDRDDRLLTEQEYNKFMEDCDRLGKDQEFQELTDTVEIQAEKIESQRLYIKMLEGLNADRASKLLELKKNFEQLEKELIKLKCLK